MDDDVQAADVLQEYEARIAALERMVGRRALEIEMPKGALKQAPGPKSGITSVVTGPAASPPAGGASFMETPKVEAVYLAAYETFEDVTADLPRFIDEV